MRQDSNRKTARTAWRAALAGIMLAGGTALGGALPAFAGSDNSALPEVSFSQTTYSANEGSAVTFVVRKNGDGEASVDYQTFATGVDNRATAGADYTAASGNLYFFPDDTELTITVQTSTDTENDESSETFGIRLSAPSGSDGNASVTLVYPLSAVGVILNCATSC